MRELKIDPNEPVCIWVHVQGQRARSERDKRKDAGKTWLPVFVYTRAGDHYDCITRADDDDDDGISSCAHEIQFTVKYNAEQGIHHTPGIL